MIKLTDEMLNGRLKQASLKQETCLDLSYFGLAWIPLEVCDLHNLNTLLLNNNFLGCLPQEIEKLKNLEMIDLRNNDFLTLPRQLASLNKLKAVYLDGTRIQHHFKIRDKRVYVLSEKKVIVGSAVLNVDELLNDNIQPILDLARCCSGLENITASEICEWVTKLKKSMLVFT